MEWHKPSEESPGENGGQDLQASFGVSFLALRYGAQSLLVELKWALPECADEMVRSCGRGGQIRVSMAEFACDVPLSPSLDIVEPSFKECA